MGLRVVFFGNSQSIFSNRHFQALTETPAQIVGVVDTPPAKRATTSPPSAQYPPFVEVARRHSIPVFEPPSPNGPDFVAAVGGLSPDLFIAVGYASVLKESILAVPRILSANFHASLLPAYRGMHPVFWALRAGERWAGLTVHVMDPGIDTGDIIYQVRVRTRRDDTVQTLYDRIMGRSLPLLERLVADAGKGAIPRRPQPPGGRSYYSKATDDQFRIDWSWDAERIRRWITSTPGQCFCEVGSQRVYLEGAERAPAPVGAVPGHLVGIGRMWCTVAAGHGAVRVRWARPEEGKPRSMAQFCRELGLKPGDPLT